MAYLIILGSLAFYLNGAQAFAQEVQPDTLKLVSEAPADSFQVFEGKILTFENVISRHAFQDLHINIRLRDNSPDDGVGGAALFPGGSDIVITYLDGTVYKGEQLGIEPILQGGFLRRGFIAADGVEEILLYYDLDSSDIAERPSRTKAEIEKIEFFLLVANHYRLDVLLNDTFVATIGTPNNIVDLSNLSVIHLSVVASPTENLTAIEPTSWGLRKDAVGRGW